MGIVHMSVRCPRRDFIRSFKTMVTENILGPLYMDEGVLGCICVASVSAEQPIYSSISCKGET